MRIGIDLTSWSNPRGYGRFTRGLVPALLSRDQDRDYTLFVDVQTARQTELPEGGRVVVMPTRSAPTRAAGSSSSRSLADLWTMRASVSSASLDLFFFPTVYTYFPIRRRSVTVVLGVHDVIAEDFPELIFPQPLRRWLWRAKSWLARRRADYLLTVSEHARQGLLRHFAHPEDRVWVVGEAADPVFRPLAASEIDAVLLGRQGLAVGDPYVAYLGGVNPHKNLPALVRSLAELRRSKDLASLQVVVIGDVSSDNFTPGVEETRSAIRDLGLGDAVRFTGFLSDAQTVHLLNAALALVLPSYAEGFGLPAVEAAACGTPVVATRNSPLPQLLAGGGLFIDPHRPEELTRALEGLLTTPGLRDQMGRRALECARRLSWDRSAEEFLALVAEIERGRG